MPEEHSTQLLREDAHEEQVDEPAFRKVPILQTQVPKFKLKSEEHSVHPVESQEVQPALQA